MDVVIHPQTLTVELVIITTPLATVMRDATILITVVMTFLKLDVLVSCQANSLFAHVHTHLQGYGALVSIILRERDDYVELRLQT